MKTKRFEKILTLSKVTLANLDSQEMNFVRGQGTYGSCAKTCDPCDTVLKTCRYCPVILTAFPAWTI